MSDKERLVVRKQFNPVGKLWIDDLRGEDIVIHEVDYIDIFCELGTISKASGLKVFVVVEKVNKEWVKLWVMLVDYRDLGLDEGQEDDYRSGELEGLFEGLKLAKRIINKEIGDVEWVGFILF